MIISGWFWGKNSINKQWILKKMILLEWVDKLLESQKSIYKTKYKYIKIIGNCFQIQLKMGKIKTMKALIIR